MNKKKVEIEYAATLEKTALDHVSHLTQYGSDEVAAINKIENLIGEFEGKVSESPYIYAPCPELVELGVPTFRQKVSDGVRLIHEVEEYEDKIVVKVLLLLGQKQSIQNQLITHCLIHK